MTQLSWSMRITWMLFSDLRFQNTTHRSPPVSPLRPKEHYWIGQIGGICHSSSVPSLRAQDFGPMYGRWRTCLKHRWHWKDIVLEELDAWSWWWLCHILDLAIHVSFALWMLVCCELHHGESSQACHDIASLLNRNVCNIHQTQSSCSIPASGC